MIDRRVIKGQEVTAKTMFLDDEGNQLVPFDANKYPYVTVVDSNGGIISEGVAIYDPNLGEYSYTFTVPTEAPPSEGDKPYRIIWLFVDQNKREFKAVEYFDVLSGRDAYYNFDKENLKLCVCNVDFDIVIPVPIQPDEIIFNLNDGSNNIFSLSNDDIKYLGKYSDDYYFYKVEIPANTTLPHKKYHGIWKITVNASTNYFYNLIYSIDITTVQFISELRAMLDKVMKPQNLYIGYRDSDLYFYLLEGLDLLNSIWIPTSWDLSVFLHGKLPRICLLFAGMYVALNAQYLAEGDTAFSYSGQPVTLDIDRTGFIESELGRLEDWLKNDFANLKKEAIKRGMFGGIEGSLGITYPNPSNAIASIGNRYNPMKYKFY